ncbi:MAG: glycosyltransferase family 4 protein [Bacteroidetes bacterium]|nr:glycosyltransferase family 4 protein [Bacteroidota bacterium]
MTFRPHNKILFLSPYPFDKAPSQRLKYEQYFPCFEKEGYQITTSSFVDEKFWKIIYNKGNFFLKGVYTLKGYFRRIKDLFSLRKYDVVYIHLWVTPLGFNLFEWLFVSFSKKIIYDIDDLIFLGHTSDANKKSKFLKGKAKAIYLMKKADHVITCTPMLDEFVRKFNFNTTDISLDIGLYPLPNEPWVYGKSGLKALQYMALGIPTVATAIGANFRVIKNEENGILVDSFNDWKDSILRLINDQKLRESIGQNGRIHVEKSFSLSSNQSKYLEILKKMNS